MNLPMTQYLSLFLSLFTQTPLFVAALSIVLFSFASAKWQKVSLFLIALLSIWILFEIAETIQFNLTRPKDWDFLGMWVLFRTAFSGLDFYAPTDLQSIPLPFSPAPEFAQEVLSIGGQYPPPKMLLLFPLGGFEYFVSYTIWYSVCSCLLLLIIILLWRIFFPKRHWPSLFFCLGMLLFLRSTLSTFSFGQTNFLILLSLLGYWAFRDRSWGGLSLAVGACIKPIVLLVVLYPAVKQHWRVLIGFVGTSLVLYGISALVFGLDICLKYFTLDIPGRLPRYVYTQGVNQSLLATVLRVTGDMYPALTPIYHPVFIALAIILGLATAWVVYSSQQKDSDQALLLVILLALVIYPATWEHYAVSLILPILFIWKQRKEIFLGENCCICFLVLVYTLIAYRNSKFAFLGIALPWALLFIDYALARYQTKKS